MIVNMCAFFFHMQDSYLELKQIILKNSLKLSICNTHKKSGREKTGGGERR